ncbi:MAG: septation protein SepH [Micrococcales bacterium]|nr:septation protein SepH [Micrococcales bacterium]
MDVLRYDRQEGDRLILVGPDDTEFAVEVNHELRAAVRAAGRPPLPEAVPQEMPDDLKPKDIQALVRAGADPAQLAKEANAPAEVVTRYAAPVMDERAYVAERSRAIQINREESAPTLEQVTAERLAAKGVELDSLDWDAYHHDGRWICRLDFDLDGEMRTARWLVDLTGRTLTPLDEPAEWMTELELPDSPLPAARRHLTAVASGDDEFDEFAPDISPPTADTNQLSLLDELMDQRGLRGPVDQGLEPTPSALDGDVLELRQLTEVDPAQTPAPAEPATLPAYSAYTLENALGDAAPQDPGSTTERISLKDRTPDLPEPLPGPVAENAQPPASDPAAAQADPEDQAKPARGGRAKRSSVPSWDEIVFGAPKAED